MFLMRMFTFKRGMESWADMRISWFTKKEIPGRTDGTTHRFYAKTFQEKTKNHQHDLTRLHGGIIPDIKNDPGNRLSIYLI